MSTSVAMISLVIHKRAWYVVDKAKQTCDGMEELGTYEMCVALVVAWWMCGYVGKSLAGHEKSEVLSAMRLSATRPWRGSFGSEGRPWTSWTLSWSCCWCASMCRGLIGSRNLYDGGPSCGTLQQNATSRYASYADASTEHLNA